jgi:hypothetical protein
MFIIFIVKPRNLSLSSSQNPEKNAREWINGSGLVMNYWICCIFHFSKFGGEGVMNLWIGDE